MSKGDFPALRMVVDNGRLVPATQFDQERINSYRRGAIVMCKLNEEKDRVLVRKWFAIITLVVKQCQTPWKTKEDASEAIKLALGIVNLSKTVGGNFMQYPKSLTELDDPEMTEALEQMIELLSHMTGVDVETLNKEAADVGREIDQQDTNSATADLQSPVDQSPDNDEDRTSSEDGGDGIPLTGSSPSSTISAEENAVLIRYAKDVLPRAAMEETNSAQMTAIEKRWAAELQNLSPLAIEGARAISLSMRRVMEDPANLYGIAEHYADVLGCSVEELGGAA